MPADDRDDEGAEGEDAAGAGSSDSTVFPRSLSDLAELIMHPGFSAEVPFARMLDLEDAAVARDIAIRKIREGALDLCDRVAAIQIVRRAGVEEVRAELQEIVNDDTLPPIARACAWCLTGPLTDVEIPENVFERSGLDGLRGMVAEYMTTRMILSLPSDWPAEITAVLLKSALGSEPLLSVEAMDNARGAAGVPPSLAYAVAVAKNELAACRAALLDEIVETGRVGARLVLAAAASGAVDVAARRDIEEALMRLEQRILAEPHDMPEGHAVLLSGSKGQSLCIDVGFCPNITLLAVVLITNEGELAGAHCEIWPGLTSVVDRLEAPPPELPLSEAYEKLEALARACVARGEPVPHPVLVILCSLDCTLFEDADDAEPVAANSDAN